MPKMIEKATGKVWEVSEDEFANAWESGLYELPDGQEVTGRDAYTGEAVRLSAEDFRAQEQTYGSRAESKEEFLGREDYKRKEREHGDVLGKASTLVEGALNSASLGVYDALGGVIGGDDFKTRRKESKEVNDGWDTAGEVLGYLAPTGLAKAPGLLGRVAKYSPVGLAERAGQGIAARGVGKGLGKQIAYSGAGLATEGALVGAGETLSEYGLATSELERERAMGNLSSNVLYGAGIGGALGAGMKGAGAAIKKSKKIADDLASKLDSKMNPAKVSDEVAKLDLDGIQAAREAEEELIKDQLFEGTSNYRKLHAEADPMLIASGNTKRGLVSTKKSILKALDNPKGFRRNPSKIVDALEREEQILRTLKGQQDDILKKLAREDDRLIKRIDGLEDNVLKGKLANKYGDWAGKKIPKKSADAGISVPKDEILGFRNALANGEVSSLRKDAANRLDELIDANLAQQEGINALKNGKTDRLLELKSAENALKSGGGPKSGLQKLGEEAAFGSTAGALATVLPWPVAAAMARGTSEKLGELIGKVLGKAAKKTGAHTKSAVDKFLDVGAKTAELAPPLATRVLAGVQFGDEQKVPEMDGDLQKSFKQREAEIYAQVTKGPNGITMNPRARQKVAEQLSGVRLVEPALADALETMANRRISFLAKKLPKKPDFLKDTVGPDTWVPNTQEIRTFARYVEAVENPEGVESRLADGTITPEDVEAYKEVYPERYRDLRNQIASRLPELQQKLPIAKRMALSLFSDLEVEPSLNPVIFDKLQAQFSSEPGTEGGTQDPMPQPSFGAFGSMKSADKQQLTPAQKRAE